MIDWRINEPIFRVRALASLTIFEQTPPLPFACGQAFNGQEKSARGTKAPHPTNPRRLGYDRLASGRNEVLIDTCVCLRIAVSRLSGASSTGVALRMLASVQADQEIPEGVKGTTAHKCMTTLIITALALNIPHQKKTATQVLKRARASHALPVRQHSYNGALAASLDALSRRVCKRACERCLVFKRS